MNLPNKAVAAACSSVVGASVVVVVSAE